MFRCGKCHKLQPRYTPSVEIVQASRARQYAFRQDANRFKRKKNTSDQTEESWLPPKPNKHWHRTGRWIFTDDPGGKGQEIVQTIRVCPACAPTSALIQALGIREVPHDRAA